MQRLAFMLGRLVWWGAWPLMLLFLRDSERTRLVLFNAEGQVLVLRGWVASGSRWSLPGGGLHRGEKPLQGVLRETHEEVGLTLSPEELRYLGVFHSASKGFRFRLHFFTARIENKPVLHLQRLEIGMARWANPRELTPDIAEPDVVRVLDGVVRQA